MTIRSNYQRTEAAYALEMGTKFDLTYMAENVSDTLYFRFENFLNVDVILTYRSLISTEAACSLYLYHGDVYSQDGVSTQIPVYNSAGAGVLSDLDSAFTHESLVSQVGALTLREAAYHPVTGTGRNTSGALQGVETARLYKPSDVAWLVIEPEDSTTIILHYEGYYKDS